jgi:adenosylcobinamide-GDP ribazoletransferase
VAVKGLLVATQFLTRLPTPRLAVSDVEFARSIRWFPAVGLLIGGWVGGAGWLGGRVDPWLGALAALAVWVAVTGALHLDGLGDIADAAGAAHKGRERLLDVLADPHVGSFAIVTIALQLIAKVVLLRLLVDRQLWAAVLLVPAAARIGPLVWTEILPSLHDGLAARFRAAVRPVDIVLWLILLGAAAWFVPILLVAPMLMLLWAAWLRNRIGGLSGDGHGAGIELVETGLLLAAVIAGRAA